MDENYIPPPVDTNRLINILKASKNVMKTLDSGNYKTGQINPNALSEDYISEMSPEEVAEKVSSNSSAALNYDADMVRNSRLPDAIKKIMIERPIPKVSGLNHTFNAEDVAELQEKPMGPPRTPKTQLKKQLAETYAQVDSDVITISKSQLADMVSDLVNEKLLEFFVHNHNKRITEDAIKKTIGTLIKEGKLKKAV